MPTIQEYQHKLTANTIIRAPLFPEPVQVITTILLDDSLKLIGSGVQTNQTYQPVLSLEQLATLNFSPETEPFDGDAHRFQCRQNHYGRAAAQGVEGARPGQADFDCHPGQPDPLPGDSIWPEARPWPCGWAIESR